MCRKLSLLNKRSKLFEIIFEKQFKRNLISKFDVDGSLSLRSRLLIISIQFLSLGFNGDYQTRVSSGIIEGSRAGRPNYKDYLCGGLSRTHIHRSYTKYCASNFRGASEGRSHGEQSVENGTCCVARGTISYGRTCDPRSNLLLSYTT